MLAFPLPRLEHQQGADRFVGTIMTNLRASLSLRGLLLNDVPVLIAFALALLARREASPGTAPHATRADWLVVPFMLGVALTASISLNLGRIVMHTFPLYLGPVALFLERRLSGASTHLSERS
jgi:hypothetical protein